MSHVETLPANCGNCGVALEGGYCHDCGQKAKGPNVSLHEFLHEAFEEFAHVDGKILKTLRLLLTKPGQLTVEFLEGRRARYISPVRVYLTCSLLFFALAAVMPSAQRPFFTVHTVPHAAELDAETLRERQHEATVKANEILAHNVPRVMFGLMPALGLLTWMFFRRRQPFYAAHLYYSIHFHAFVFLVLMLVAALRAMNLPNQAAMLPMVGVAIYHFKSLERVFGGSAWSLIWKGTIAWVVYVAIVIAVLAAVGILAGRPLH